MTKRERLEDLGVISERLSNVLDRDILENNVSSKHDFDQWAEDLGIKDADENEELYTFHQKLRSLREDLFDILLIARGEHE